MVKRQKNLQLLLNLRIHKTMQAALIKLMEAYYTLVANPESGDYALYNNEKIIKMSYDDKSKEWLVKTRSYRFEINLTGNLEQSIKYVNKFSMHLNG